MLTYRVIVISLCSSLIFLEVYNENAEHYCLIKYIYICVSLPINILTRVSKYFGIDFNIKYMLYLTIVFTKQYILGFFHV